jgi:hypothetical protein
MRSKAPKAFTGRGAPDKTMMLGLGESFDLEEEGSLEPRTTAIPLDDKEGEIDDLFADIVEEP